MLLQQFVELAYNVRRVAVKDERVALPDLALVRHDDGLRRGALAPSLMLVLRVRRDIATPDVLVSDVTELNPMLSPGVASWRVSIDLHMDSTPRGAKRIVMPASGRPLNTANGNSPNTRDLVDVLQPKTQMFLNRQTGSWTLSIASRNSGP